MARMNASPHLLIVDDDRGIRDLVSQFLTRHGYRCTTAKNGQEMRDSVTAGRIDLVILDLMLPGEDGLSLCRWLRRDSQLPIIMLTAMGEETDRIIGLEMGADDYLPKPFNPRELLARIKAVMPRTGRPQVSEGAPSRTLTFEGWRLDLSRRQLNAPDGALVELSAGEFDLLVALAERPQRVLTRDQLIDLARGRAATPFDRSVDVQISRLRRKMEADPKNPTLIKTVRSGGYIFSAVVEAA
jgi:two-component system OmpR family response regulator